jgi:hypothetical protein
MTRRPWVSPRLVIFVTAILALASWPSATLCQTSSSAGVTCYAHLSRARLVSSGRGWAIVDQPSVRPVDHPGSGDHCMDEHFYWTDNDGQTWRDITPRDMPTRSVGTLFFFGNLSRSLETIFFLDRSHGWRISTDDVNGDGKGEGDERFYLLTTQNGGKSWKSLLLERQMVNSAAGMFPTDIFFSDPSHGWILWRWAEMNSRVNALTATSDGGRTWRTLSVPPGPGPMQFTSAHDGWMVGGSPGQEGIGVVEDDQLWVTRDGGEHWNTVSIPVPADHPYSVRFGELKFNERGDGVVVAQTSLSGYVQRFFGCVTRDGGRSWQISQFDGYEATPSLVGTHIIWTVFHEPKTHGTIFERTETPNTIRVGDREFAPIVPEALSLEGVLNAVDFIDDANGWTTYVNGRPAFGGLPAAAFTSLELLSTTDGGKTFRTITPPAAEQHPIATPELYLLNGAIVRFPALPPLALRRPPILANGPGQIRFAPPAGGPTIIQGTGFQRENTVWIGSHQIQAASSDGKNLQFLIPPNITPGTYRIYVENSHGKTNETEISIRSPESLAISNINNGQTIRPGQEILLTGSGLLIENQVWFGKQAVPATLIISGGPMLRVSVPTSIPPGSCDVYVSNATGNSNVVSVVID